MIKAWGDEVNQFNASKRLVWGFTASRQLPVLAQSNMVERLKSLSYTLLIPVTRPELEFVSGAANGGDAFIGEWLVRQWEDRARHTVVVPWNHSQVDTWWLRLPSDLARLVEVIQMPEGTEYKDRNQFMVDRSTDFDGFPLRPASSLRRSGTWQAVRMADRAGKLRRVTTTYCEG